MELRVLGCSGGIGAGMHTTSLLVDEDVLLDAGTGVGELPLEALRKIRHVFLTHSHLDHIAGLPMIVDTLFGVYDSPLTVHALPETIEILKQHIFNWQVWPDFGALPNPEKPCMIYQPMQYGEQLAIAGRQIQMVEVSHTVPAAGYSVSGQSGSIAFTGDTSSNDTLWQALNKLDDLQLLIVECAFADEEQALSDLAKHYCPKYLAEDIKKLQHDIRIAITHLKPGYEELIMAECRAAMPHKDLLQLRGGEVFTI